MKPFGLILIAVAILAPVIWLPGIAQGRDLIALFSQYLGLAALIAMAIAHLIATRWRIVEWVFGPLDQSYRVHKWLGIGAMVAILLHDTIDAEMKGLGAETALVELAETLGEISLYGLLILVVITIATFIPYHLWKWTHRLIGVFFVMGAFHYLFILKPFANMDPLGIYMLVVCGLGLVAFAYTSAPRVFRPFRRYQITGLEHHGAAVAVSMKPLRLGIRHRPGQFAFASFVSGGLTEPHPFTLSAPPQKDGSLRMTIAPLGDYTGRVLRALEVGADVRIEGPYGHFGARLQGPQIWVAAGIGITPFAALAGALDQTHGPVKLIYSVRDAENAPHLDELRQIAKDTAGFDLILWETSQKGRLSVDAIVEQAGDDLSTSRVLFCGPVEMRRSLQAGLATHGVTGRRFQYEEFEIRTGLGLRRIAGRLGLTPEALRLPRANGPR